MVTTVSIAGSTGSIGTQTLDVIAAEPDRFEVVALGAGSSVDALAAQARLVSPKVVAIGDASLAAQLEAAVPSGTEVLAGPDALAQIATLADVCVNGVVGFAGLGVTLATLEAGKRLALVSGPERAIWSRSTASTAPCTSAYGPSTPTGRQGSGSPDSSSPRRAVPSGAAVVPTSLTSRSTMPWPTRPGPWARRSRSTHQP
jgi:hypothetical protein